MVIKPEKHHYTLDSMFESSVISYGNQTKIYEPIDWRWFESSVISYGNQT